MAGRRGSDRPVAEVDMEQTQQERERYAERVEELQMARARRALVEHELHERRFDLFQRKAWFWILAATTMAFGVVTIVLAITSSEPLRIGASLLGSLAAGTGVAATRARKTPPEP